jgi:hypothetical protein
MKHTSPSINPIGVACPTAWGPIGKNCSHSGATQRDAHGRSGLSGYIVCERRFQLAEDVDAARREAYRLETDDRGAQPLETLRIARAFRDFADRLARGETCIKRDLK